MKNSCMMESFTSSSASLRISMISEAEGFFFPLLTLVGSSSSLLTSSILEVLARALVRCCQGGSLGAVATKVSLFFAGKTLACFHKLCPFVCVDLPSPSTPRGGIHGIWVSVCRPFPCGLPLFKRLRFLARF